MPGGSGLPRRLAGKGPRTTRLVAQRLQRAVEEVVVQLVLHRRHRAARHVARWPRRGQLVRQREPCEHGCHRRGLDHGARHTPGEKKHAARGFRVRGTVRASCASSIKHRRRACFFSPGHTQAGEKAAVVKPSSKRSLGLLS